ncbi:MAG TPA: HAMP domain-containing sensor histidine kinase [Azospirillum sp.]
MKRYGPLARLGELKVATRISVGFGIALALVLALALAGVLALSGVSRNVGSFSATTDVSQTAADADIILRDLEASVRDVLVFGDADSLAESERRHAAVAERLDALAKVAASEADRAAASEARMALDGFWTGYRDVVALRGDRARLIGSVLDPMVEQVRVRFAKLKDSGGVDSASLAADAAISVMMMRDHLARYVERRDPKDAERMRAELEAARTRLSELTRYLWVQGTRQVISELDSLLGSLAGVLDRIEEVAGDEDRMRAEALEPNAATVALRTAEIRQRNDAAAEALRRQLAERTAFWVKLTLWVGGLVLVLGGLTTWMVARSVARPMGAVTEAVSALAEGRTDRVTLPAVTGDDEIARMARAVETLRANADEIAQLKREAAETQDQLRQEKARAEAENQAKSDFLVNMGHELHGPLNAIVHASQSLMGELHRMGAGDLSTEAERIQWSGEQLVGLVDAILDYARIEAGGMDVCLQDFDVARLIAEVRERTYPAADLNGNSLTVTGAPALGGMHSDFVKVRQVLLNLLDNACKFTIGGDVTLTAERQDRDGRAWLRFVVADTGPGFPAGQVGRLFRPFVQGADGAGKGKTPGAGLGLTLVGHYVAMLGGDIEVASESGNGTRIALMLPAVYEAPAEDRPLLTEATPGDAPPRALLTVADVGALPQAS